LLSPLLPLLSLLLLVTQVSLLWMMPSLLAQSVLSPLLAMHLPFQVF
jgi:hypothetical protein